MHSHFYKLSVFNQPAVIEEKMDGKSDVKLLEQGYRLALIFAMAGILGDGYTRRAEFEAVKLDLPGYAWWFITDNRHLTIAAGSLILATFMVASVLRHRQKPDEDKDNPD